MNLEEKIQKLKQIRKDATSGPWRRDCTDNGYQYVSTPSGQDPSQEHRSGPHYLRTWEAICMMENHFEILCNTLLLADETLRHYAKRDIVDRIEKNKGGDLWLARHLAADTREKIKQLWGVDRS